MGPGWREACSFGSSKAGSSASGSVFASATPRSNSGSSGCSSSSKGNNGRRGGKGGSKGGDSGGRSGGRPQDCAGQQGSDAGLGYWKDPGGTWEREDYDASRSNGSSSPAGRRMGRPSSFDLPQLQLQAWLQEQGLQKADAATQARRLALVFGSEEAALADLPATFAWCCGRGLTGPQTAALLSRVASLRRESVMQFAATAQRDWQLIDGYIAAYIKQQELVSRLIKHSCLADLLRSSPHAARALSMPPNHVPEWLIAVRQHLPTATIGRLLLSSPMVATGSPQTAVAAIAWATRRLGVTDLGAFFSAALSLLAYDAETLQRNLVSLRKGLGLTRPQVRQLVMKRPPLLQARPEKVQAAAAWLRQLFPAADQLAGVLDRGPHLLNCSVQHLQGNADTLQRALGWRHGDGQLADYVAAYPQAFAISDFSSEDTEAKLLLLSQVVGVPAEVCLGKGSSYLSRHLETICALYVLVQVRSVNFWFRSACLGGHSACRRCQSMPCLLPPDPSQERAPQLLRNRGGGLHLSWIRSANKPENLALMGLTPDQLNTLVQEWPASNEGQRLLEGLSCGSCRCLPVARRAW